MNLSTKRTHKILSNIEVYYKGKMFIREGDELILSIVCYICFEIGSSNLILEILKTFIVSLAL